MSADIREHKLAALVNERARIAASQKEAKDAMKEVMDQCDAEIKKLAQDIESGQLSLLES
jgi:hypothetical protein